jgi:1,2-dihydroxy-3-keto-5-methylthiopentene dioxygenase
MAILRLENGKTYQDWDQIASHIGGLKIVIDCMSVADSLQPLMTKELLTNHEQQQILRTQKNQVKAIARRDRFERQDVMVLHPGSPLLYPVLKQNQRWHTHNESEGLHILAGECIIGLKDAEGREMELLLEAQDYIKIPAGVLHWFALTHSLEVKVLRYHSTAHGLQPQYAIS